MKSLLVFFCFASPLLAAELAHADLSVVWSVSAPEEALKSWDPQSLTQLKAVSSQEKDPVSGKLTHYKGVLLSQVLEQAMAKLPADRKAQVDLLVLKNAAGGQVLLPRSVVVKYPVLLALGEGKTSVVMPWTSKPRIMGENLPVESYFVANLTRIELTNYHERYGSVFLKRRTDPLAMRGEKLFVQNCVGCHSDGTQHTLSDLAGLTQTRRLASDGHPTSVKGVPVLNEKDRRALTNYLDAFRAENSAKTASF